jgi:hypothetical protein
MEQLIDFKDAQIEALKKKIELLESDLKKQTELVEQAKEMFNQMIKDYEQSK